MKFRALSLPLAVALLLPGSLAFAGVAMVTPGLPLGGTVIPFERPGQKVVFSSLVLVIDRSTAGWRLSGGPWIRLTICRKGGAKIVRYPAPGKLPTVHEEIPVEELVALIPGKFTEKQQFEWTLLVGSQDEGDLNGFIARNHISPSEARRLKDEGLSSLTQEFTLTPPPDLAVHVGAHRAAPARPPHGHRAALDGMAAGARLITDQAALRAWVAVHGHCQPGAARSRTGRLTARR